MRTMVVVLALLMTGGAAAMAMVNDAVPDGMDRRIGAAHGGPEGAGAGPGMAGDGQGDGQGTLTVTIRNLEAAGELDLRVEDDAGTTVYDDTVALPAEDTWSATWRLPAQAYKVLLEGGSMRGSGNVGLDGCPGAAADVAVETTFKDTPEGPEGAGIRVSVGCADADEARGTDDGPEPSVFKGGFKLRVAATLPTCLHGCSTSYAQTSGAMRFPVLEGATSIEVRMTWTPSTPASERLRGALSLQEDDASRRGMDTAEGTGTVHLRQEAPPAGTYHVSAWPAGPAGAAWEQDVEVEAVVVYG